ncbi:MAG: hypothetical protein GY855_04110, partial [candidate division Zixibacteria bacterium]|nr:hypothetical protein [candidate division Zixibacteria bacterium]
MKKIPFILLMFAIAIFHLVNVANADRFKGVFEPAGNLSNVADDTTFLNTLNAEVVAYSFDVFGDCQICQGDSTDTLDYFVNFDSLAPDSVLRFLRIDRNEVPFDIQGIDSAWYRTIRKAIRIHTNNDGMNPRAEVRYFQFFNE